MRAVQILSVAAVGAALATVGCPPQADDSSTTDAVTETPTAELTDEIPAVPGTPGGIKIVIGLAGTPPEAQPLDRKADPVCAKIEKLDPAVLVTDGKLQNVLVRITGEVQSDLPAPTKPVKLRQTECMFEPRVSAARAGQKIEIANDDSTMFMVQAYRGEEKKSWFNTAQPPGASPIVQVLEPGMVQLKGGSHPWMAAFLSVTDHPFNAVTGVDGTVSWDLVPSAVEPYRIETWHEVFGKRELEIVVEPGKVTEVIVTYEVNGAK